MRYRILVVDDDKSILDLIADLLSTDHDVTTAGDAARALEHLASNSFDLLILDLGLPGMSGVDLIQQIRTHELERRTPILVLSAYLELREKLSGAEVDAFLPKPFGVLELEQKVSRLLRADGAGQAFRAIASPAE